MKQQKNKTLIKTKRKLYPSDLTDKQWLQIKPLIPLAKSNNKDGGRERTTDMQEVLNAIFYLLFFIFSLPQSARIKSPAMAKKYL